MWVLVRKQADGVDEQRIHGFAYIQITAEQTPILAHIYALYLTPEVLGQGFGRRLAQLMLSTAQSAGATRITLESSITAHEFYRRIGFVDCGAKMQVIIGDYPVTCFPMQLDLSDR